MTDPFVFHTERCMPVLRYLPPFFNDVPTRPTAGPGQATPYAASELNALGPFKFPVSLLLLTSFPNVLKKSNGIPKSP